MKNSATILSIVLSLVCLLAFASPNRAFGQAAEETPPPKKSKLDAPQEEEAPPTKKSKLDTPSEEEAPPKKKSKLDTPEEEETPPKKPSTKPSASGEETPPTRKTPSASSSESGSEDEEKEQRVCDLVFVNQKSMKVRLFETPFEFPVPGHMKEKEFRLPRLPEKSEKEKSIAYYYAKGAEITGVRYYEDIMWQKAAEALKVTQKQLAEPGKTFDLSSPPAVQGANQAEKILVTAIAEHDSAVAANLRKGLQWDKMLRQPLIQALLNLRLSRVDLLLAEGKLSQAERACDNLLAEFRDAPGAPDAVRDRFEKIFLTQAEQAADRARQSSSHETQASGFAEARRLLDELERRYPRIPGTAAVKFRDGLIKEAKDLTQQAEALPEEQAREAKALLARAAMIWPALPGLESHRDILDKKFRVLNCAYTSLPVNFSPTLARTPVERHAVSLLFESLVRWWDGKADDNDPGEGGHYESQLAQGRPVPLARGRQFYLNEARWSDSTATEPHLVTLEDVRSTVKLLSNPAINGHLPAWAGLVRGDVQPLANDPFTVCIWLNRDHWQPLSLMDFKILPRSSFMQGTQAEMAAFNSAPVGTGPYVLSEALETGQVRFVANPHYRQAGKPHINEIVFHRLEAVTAKNEFLQGKIHLMFDVQPEHVAEIRQQRRTVKTLQTHSVWFLAPRYSHSNRPSQLDNKNLRLAIAHSIDRESILGLYRTGNSADHAALTGPYPKSSWAYNNKGMEFKATLATGYASEARKELKNILPLRLVYPDNDPITEAACKQIQTQVATTSIQIDLEAVPPEALPKTLDDGNYDLAYWRHDFKDQTYWLWPLLDPQGIGPGGPNFMRYYQDRDLADLFNQLNSHKKFPEIRDLTHKVHEHIFKNAIVVPLWQLDTYVAVDDALKNVRLDPWVLYGNVEEWDLQLRSK